MNDAQRRKQMRKEAGVEQRKRAEENRLRILRKHGLQRGSDGLPNVLQPKGGVRRHIMTSVPKPPD